jgi:protein TonB
MKRLRAERTRLPGDLTLRRFCMGLLPSAALHVAVLALCASAFLRLPALVTDVIPLTIREPAPPPPPPGASGGPLAGVSSAAEVAAKGEVEPIEKPEPVKIARRATPVERKRHRHTPTPRPPAAQKERPRPAPAVVAAPAPARLAAGTPQGGRSAAPGVLGGIAGGVVGGEIGGRLGGGGDGVWTVGQVAVRPQVVRAVRPKYPALARAREVEGVVVLEGVVDRQGVVEASGVRVVQSVPLLDQAALDAFRRWRFRAGRDERGNPVRVVLRQPIRFRLH